MGLLDKVGKPTSTHVDPRLSQHEADDDEADALTLLREAKREEAAAAAREATYEGADAAFRAQWRETFGAEPYWHDVERFHSLRRWRKLRVADYVAECKARRDADEAAEAERQAREAAEKPHREREAAERARAAAEKAEAERVSRAARMADERRARHAELKARLTLDDDDNETAAAPPLIPDVLPAGKIVLLVAPKSHGKSIVATGIGLCLASGRWLDGTTVEPSSVLNVSLEMTADDTKIFRNRIARGLGIEPGEYRDRLHQYRTEDGENSVRFDRAESLQEFRDTVAQLSELDDLKAIVIDSLSELTGDLDVNSNTAMKPLMKELQRIRDEFKVTILLLAHSSEPGEIVRGARTVTESADLEYRLVRANPNAHDSVMSLTRHKVRIGIDVRDRIQLRAPDGEDQAITLEVADDKPARTKPRLTPRARQVVAVVGEHGPIGRNEILRHVGGSQTTLGDSLKAASAAGLIGQNSDEKWVATEGSDL